MTCDFGAGGEGFWAQGVSGMSVLVCSSLQGLFGIIACSFMGSTYSVGGNGC